MRVFISYAHADQSFVATLDTELGKHGVDVWYDRKPGVGLRGGETWEQRLQNELDSSLVVLVVLSPDSTRAGSFVANEYQFALNKKSRVIPLLYHDCTVPLALIQFQYVDFVHKSLLGAFADLLTALNVPMPPALPVLAPNPFENTGCIHDTSRFFNREKEIESILKALEKNHSVSVISDPKSGRTSLLYHLGNIAGPKRISAARFAFVNLEVCSNEKTFYEEVCTRLGGTGNSDRNLKTLVGLGRVVLCIDGVEKFNAKGFGDHIRSFLRGMSDGSDAPMKLIVGSRQSLVQLFPDQLHKTSPFYNIFVEVITLSNFSRADCDRFLDARLANTGVQFDTATRDEVWTLTQGHPYKLQRAAHHRYNAANDPTYDWHARFREDALLVK